MPILNGLSTVSLKIYYFPGILFFFKIFGVNFNEKDEVGKFNQERPVNYFSHKAESAVEPRY